ncbi:MAG: hypothetical protein LUC97_09195 [Clostridiales bacterium]|nr:hypothetical protein [Clostridiales bacterium]
MRLIFKRKLLSRPEGCDIFDEERNIAYTIDIFKAEDTAAVLAAVIAADSKKHTYLGKR